MALLGLAAGFGGYTRTHNYLDRTWTTPASVIEREGKAGNALGEIAHMYYDPNHHDSYAGNVLGFYNISPVIALEKLEGTKNLLNKHRNLLAEAGYLKSLPEDQLELAMRNVKTFIEHWPLDASEWYAYLYAGDLGTPDYRGAFSPRDDFDRSKWPPRTYAQEIKLFYEAAQNLRLDSFHKKSAAEGEQGGKAVVSAFSGLGAAIALWFSCWPLGILLENRYKLALSREHLAQKLEKLRAMDTA